MSYCKWIPLENIVTKEGVVNVRKRMFQFRSLALLQAIIIRLYYNYSWAASWQNQQNDFAPSEDSDQPGHSPSLIRVFAVRMKKAWDLSYQMSALRTTTNWAQADLSLRWAHSHFVSFVTRRLSCISNKTYIQMYEHFMHVQGHCGLVVNSMSPMSAFQASG